MSEFAGRAAPPRRVAEPTRERPLYGLFSVATRLPDNVLEDHWQTGVEWEPMACEPARLASGVCFTPEDLEEFGEGEGEGEGEGPEGWPLVARRGEERTLGQPFSVIGSYLCSSMSRPLDEAVQRARAHLLQWEETAVEFALATGSFDNEPTFADAVDLTPAAGASLIEGVGLLEEYVALNHGGIGVIHAPRRLAAPMHELRLVDRRGQRMETVLGNRVAFGGGYDLANVGPGNLPADPGKRWLYVTGIPIVRASEIFVHPDAEFLPQRSNNDVEIFAARVYVVAWDCITAAVEVDAADASEDNGGE